MRRMCEAFVGRVCVCVCVWMGWVQTKGVCRKKSVCMRIVGGVCLPSLLHAPRSTTHDATETRRMHIVDRTTFTGRAATGIAKYKWRNVQVEVGKERIQTIWLTTG